MFAKFRFIIFYFRRVLAFLIIFGVILLNGFSTNHYNVFTNDSKSIPLVAVAEHQLSMDSSKVFNFIQLENKEGKIRNSDTFGPIAEDTIILVIMLDAFSSGFKFLVSSLSKVRGIEEVLVIFSHSFFSEDMNKVIMSIEFCRVWQIYYPYSIQTHPKEFPGYDPSDCPYEISKYSRTNCSGTFLDVRGRFRNPPGAQRKHHWWWTANNIFENFSNTAKHTGLVIFSEDNIIFMKDFIYMASYMRNVANSLPQCEFLSLGIDTPPAKSKIIEPSDFYSLKLSSWNLKEHSRILAFDKSVWNSIVSHYDVFCTLDDASWLRSLFFISVHRRDGKRFKAMSAVTPRAYKIDSCSSERSRFFSSRCNLTKNVLTVSNIEKRNDGNWFPSHLELYINVELDSDDDVIFDYSEGNGGWADPRDWELCRNMTEGKIKKILMEMKNEFNEYFCGKS